MKIPFRYKLYTFFEVVLLIATSILESLWSVYELPNAYLGSRIGFSLLFLFPGILTLFFPEDFVLWVQMFRKGNVLRWDELGFRNQLFLRGIVVLYTTFALIVLVTTF